jgi:hypothetical protein
VHKEFRNTAKTGSYEAENFEGRFEVRSDAKMRQSDSTV